MNDKNETKGESKIENYVIVSLIALGMIGGAIIYFLEDGKPLSAVFISFGLASLIYRFLGGITRKTEFKIGLFKLGGSAAFIIGSIFFLNNYILKEIIPRNEIIINRPASKWFPFQIASGLPDKVVIKDTNENEIVFELGNSDKGIVEDHRYTLVKEGNSYSIKSKRDPNFLIGKVDQWDLSDDLFNNIEKLDVCDIFKLHPYKNEDSEYRNPNFPFYLKVYEGYLDIFLKKDDIPLEMRVVVGKGVRYIFKIENDFYIVMVLEANHQIEKEEWYSDYLVGKLIPSKKGF